VNYKYLGEAIALLGIAYSVFRWVIRNAPESDRPGPGRIEIDLARLPRRPVEPGYVPAPAPEPEMVEGAAAMFGITADALLAMDPRERALLLSGYRAARNADSARLRGPSNGD